MIFVSHQYIAAFRALGWPHDASSFELIHDAARAVEADAELTLDVARRGLLVEYHKVGDIVKHGIPVVYGFGSSRRAAPLVVICRLWQFHGLRGPRLIVYEGIDGLNLARIYKRALYTHGLRPVEEQHVAHTDKLVGSLAVQYGTRVYLCTHTESHTAWEVGLDVARDNAGGGSLGGYHHVYAHGTCQLGYTGYRHLYLLACGHNEVAKLVYDDHYVVACNEIESSIPFDKLYKIIETDTNYYLMASKVSGTIICKADCPNDFDAYIHKFINR